MSLHSAVCRSTLYSLVGGRGFGGVEGAYILFAVTPPPIFHAVASCRQFPAFPVIVAITVPTRPHVSYRQLPSQSFHVYDGDVVRRDQTSCNIPEAVRPISVMTFAKFLRFFVSLSKGSRPKRGRTAVKTPVTT